jgi:two-component system chemotaxis sensor kinase CheA
MHIIRNAIDHGIELPPKRVAAGKPEAGTIALGAHQRGNHVVIEIEDDGGGLNDEAILRKAIERGMVDRAQAAEMGRREIHNLMFLPGVSTKDVADELSGRGVGMDVVKTNIAKLSGIIDVSSEPGCRTKFAITLPITLAIIQALVIRVAGRTYCVPLNSVLESLLTQTGEVRTVERREVITLRGVTLPLLRLAEVFRLPVGERPAEGPLYVVVVGLAQHRLGLVVDELVGQRDIVIKPLGRMLSQIPGIAGATELGGQQTVLVLDVAALVEEAISRAQEIAA